MRNDGGLGGSYLGRGTRYLELAHSGKVGTFVDMGGRHAVKPGTYATGTKWASWAVQ
jgi:hypothetical protein